MLPELSAARAAARAAVAAQVWDYVELGDPDDRAEAAWQAWAHRPRVLRDVGRVDPATTLLGRPAPSPLLVAPTANHGLLHPDGEVATAAGACAAATTMIVSTRASRTFADLAATGVDWWLQVYAMRERGLTHRLVDAAVAAGARALVLTGDTPYLAGQRAVAGPLATHASHTVNLDLPDGPPAGATVQDPTVTVDAVAELARRSGLPVLVKGVLRGDEARRCVDAGAAGVVVSNHGGRQLPRAVPTAMALAEVVAAVGGDAEVYVDGGIRDGAAAATALALGARGVCVGRPVQWGLAAGGADGVRGVLAALTADLTATMGLLGAATTAGLTPDLVTADPVRPPDRPGSPAAGH